MLLVRFVLFLVVSVRIAQLPVLLVLVIITLQLRSINAMLIVLLLILYRIALYVPNVTATVTLA